MAHTKQNQKVIKLADGIFGTTAAVYGPSYKGFTKVHFPIVIYAVAHLRTLIQTAGNEPIIFKPIRGEYAGMHFPHSNRIFVDPRGSTMNIITIIAHEMVHAEQHFTGKMQAGGEFRIWNGKSYRYPRSHKEYMSLPWEKEAYARQRGLAEQAVASCIKMTNIS